VNIFPRLRIYRISLLLLCAGLFAPRAFADSVWIEPTKEELAMTTFDKVPGAAAIYLNREEITLDSRHEWSVYARIKVLTE
jgi:hypothetical protein